VNHIVVGALMLAVGALLTFGAASAVQIWAISRQPQAEYNPHLDSIASRPPVEYRKRSSDCQTPLGPQTGMPTNAKCDPR
jgi:hypothetical protein